MSTYNANNNGASKNNSYGHLLDKYLDSNHVDWETRQQREKEAKNRYGHLLDYAKPNLSTLNLAAKMEEDGRERQKQREEEEKLDNLRRRIRIGDEKRKVDEHDAKVSGFAESVMARKEARIKEEERKHKEEERQ